MGFLGGNNDSEADRLAEEELRANKANLETKKQSLYQSRLDIIKGQGEQTWTANREPKKPPKEKRSPYAPFKGF